MKEDQDINPIVRAVSASKRTTLSYNLQRIESIIADTKSKLPLMEVFFVDFILQPDLKADQFFCNAEELFKEHSQYRLSYNTDDSISFGDIEVSLVETLCIEASSPIKRRRRRGRPHASTLTLASS